VAPVNFKYRRASLWGGGFLLAAAAALVMFHSALLRNIGIFLVVEETVAEPVDAVLTWTINEKVSICYRAGQCKKIYILLEDYQRSWKALRSFDVRGWHLKNAERLEISKDDLVFINNELGDAVDAGGYLRRLFAEREIRSAILLVPYFQTRTYRFFLDRNENWDPDRGRIFIQPLEKDYAEQFDCWWLNTGLDNLYLDQYLRIGWYYFNKLLLS